MESGWMHSRPEKSGPAKWFQYLSLDVVIGSLAMGGFACVILQVRPQPLWWFILASSVWIIYTLDHLLDGWKARGSARIERHNFHYNNRRLLLVILLTLSIITAGLSLVFLEKEIIIAALIIVLLSFIYFGIVFFFSKSPGPFLQKEFIIALIYISGIWLGPLFWSAGLPSSEVLLIMAGLFLLAWSEGILAAYFEVDQDLYDGHTSFARLFGRQTTRHFLVILYLLVVIGMLVVLLQSSDLILMSGAIIILVMNHLLLICMRYPSYFAKNSRYKWLGELVFWLPALLIVWT